MYVHVFLNDMSLYASLEIIDYDTQIFILHWDLLDAILGMNRTYIEIVHTCINLIMTNFIVYKAECRLCRQLNPK